MPSSMVRHLLYSHNSPAGAKAEKRRANSYSFTVKFDSEQLPSILNALTTENGGNKLTLEVAVRDGT